MTPDSDVYLGPAPSRNKDTLGYPFEYKEALTGIVNGSVTGGWIGDLPTPADASLRHTRTSVNLSHKIDSKPRELKLRGGRDARGEDRNIVPLSLGWSTEIKGQNE